jgi:hypothetical protein
MINKRSQVTSLLSSCKQSTMVYSRRHWRPIKEYAPNGNLHGAILRERDKIRVVFKGTCDVYDFAHSLDIRHIDLIEGGICHKGYHDRFSLVKDDLFNDIDKLCSKHDINKLVLCGHSMGGAIAFLASFYCSRAFPSKEIHYHSFGAPKVANKALYDDVFNTIKDHSVVELTHDLVPRILYNPLIISNPHALVLPSVKEKAILDHHSSQAYWKALKKIYKKIGNMNNEQHDFT